jgi:hypothetical protein
VIYAYGITEPGPGLPPSTRGIGGVALRVLESGGLAVVYSRHRSVRARPSPALVLQHERVLEALMERGPVLPMRFGTQLENTDRLADALTARQDDLLPALDRVRGRVEIGIRALPIDPSPTRARSPPSGRDYVLSRVAAHRRHERVIAQIHRPLQALASASVVRERSTSPAVMVASYLVDTRQVDDFRRRANELVTDQHDLRVVVTGPWPPYSFTGEGAE